MSTDDQVPDGDDVVSPRFVDELSGDAGVDADTPSIEPIAPPTQRNNRRPLIIGAVGAAVGAVLVIVGIVIFDEASAAISAGTGTATITWTRAPNNGDTSTNPPQPFSGTINGHALSGLATVVIPTGSTNPFVSSTGVPKSIVAFRFKGSFDGKPFNITLGIQYPTSTTSANTGALSIEGTYDGQAVHAAIGAPTNPTSSIPPLTFGAPTNTNPNQPSPPVPFSGTIGHRKVMGDHPQFDGDGSEADGHGNLHGALVDHEGRVRTSQ
jgi:hypothetical protein